MKIQTLLPKSFLSLCIVVLPTLSTAQQTTEEPTINREIGLRLSNFDNFGAIYKKELSENRYFRVSAAVFNFNLNLVESGTSNINLYLSSGIEKRRNIGEKFNFIHGINFNGGINFQGNTEASITQISLGAGYLLGFIYDLNDHFYIGLETIPSINVGLTSSGDSNYLFVSGGFNSTSNALTLVYKL